MRSDNTRWPFAWALMIVGCFWPALGHAGLVVQLDQFQIHKNGTNYFTDNFSGGLTPSQEPGIYSVFGAYPNGAAAGGLLTVSTEFGSLTTNAAGQARQTLNTVRTSSLTNLSTGLTVNDTIDVGGVFSIVPPSGPLSNGYGVAVVDATPGQPTNRFVQMVIQYFPALGEDVIRFDLSDFVSGTITTLGVVPLAPPAGADQIELLVSRPDVTNNNFFGSYAFGTGGTFGALTTFATPGDLFTDTNFVRGRFEAFTGIPEPATLALLGLGLAGLGFSRRKH